VTKRFGDALQEYSAGGLLKIEGDRIVLERHGLLIVDTLLERFFLEEHRNTRYF